jgi:hypothetical protein
MKDYALSITSNEDIERIIESKIEEMLKEKEFNFPANNQIPILRVKIEITGYNMIRSNFLISKYSGKIANLADVIQYHKKTDPIKINYDCHDDNEHDIKQHLISLEEEMADNYDELKIFMNQSIYDYFSDRKPLISSEVFCDSLEKAVNGNEKKAVDIMYKRLFDYTIKNAKLDNNILRDFSPFEKKDYFPLLLEQECIKRFNKNTIVSNDNSNIGMNVISESSNSIMDFNKKKKGRKIKEKEKESSKKEEMEVDFDKFSKENTEMKYDLNEFKNPLNIKPNLINLGVEEEFIQRSKDPTNNSNKVTLKNNPVKINTLDGFFKKATLNNNPSNLPNASSNLTNTNVTEINNHPKNEETNTGATNKRKYGLTNDLPMFKKKKN